MSFASARLTFSEQMPLGSPQKRGAFKKKLFISADLLGVSQRDMLLLFALLCHEIARIGDIYFSEALLAFGHPATASCRARQRQPRTAMPKATTMQPLVWSAWNNRRDK